MDNGGEVRIVSTMSIQRVVGNLTINGDTLIIQGHQLQIIILHADMRKKYVKREEKKNHLLLQFPH